jgi:hypothetical protein
LAGPCIVVHFSSGKIPLWKESHNDGPTDSPQGIVCEIKYKLTHIAARVKGTVPRSFLIFLGKMIVNGQHSDIWKFGKGALSELRFCGVAAIQE